MALHRSLMMLAGRSCRSPSSVHVSGAALGRLASSSSGKRNSKIITANSSTNHLDLACDTYHKVGCCDALWCKWSSFRSRDASFWLQTTTIHCKAWSHSQATLCNAWSHSQATLCNAWSHSHTILCNAWSHSHTILCLVWSHSHAILCMVWSHSHTIQQRSNDNFSDSELSTAMIVPTSWPQRPQLHYLTYTHTHSELSTAMIVPTSWPQRPELHYLTYTHTHTHTHIHIRAFHMSALGIFGRHISTLAFSPTTRNQFWFTKYELIKSLQQKNCSIFSLNFSLSLILLSLLSISSQGYMQYLFDQTGKRYLDLFAGIVTVGVGHCHPWVSHVVLTHLCTLSSLPFISSPLFLPFSLLFSLLSSLPHSFLPITGPNTPEKWMPASKTRWTSYGTPQTSTCTQAYMSMLRSLLQSCPVTWRSSSVLYLFHTYSLLCGILWFSIC